MLSTNPLGKIERLTQEQEQELVNFRETIRIRSLSCEPVDIQSVRTVMASFYRRIGIDNPPMVWVCDSPFQAQILIHLFKQGIGDNLRANLGDNLGGDIAIENTWMWGAMDAYWIAFYRFPHEHIRPMYSEDKYKILMEWDTLAASCGQLWAYTNIVFVSDRPREIHFDDSWRLHNESGPALRYSDGYSLYSYHGVTVPAKVIAKDFAAADITNEANTEIRRVMQAVYGTSSYIRDIGAEPYHRDKTGILYRVQEPDDEPIAMTRVLNSTPEPDGTLTRDEARDIFGVAAYATEGHGPETRWKEYWDGVPPDMETCAQAVAWGFGMTESEYAPEMET